MSKKARGTNIGAMKGVNLWKNGLPAQEKQETPPEPTPEEKQPEAVETVEQKDVNDLRQPAPPKRRRKKRPEKIADTIYFTPEEYENLLNEWIRLKKPQKSIAQKRRKPNKSAVVNGATALYFELTKAAGHDWISFDDEGQLLFDLPLLLQRLQESEGKI